MALEKAPSARIGDVVLLKQGIGVIRDNGSIDSDDSDEETKYFAIDVLGQDNNGNHGVVAKDFIRVISSEDVLEKLSIFYDILNSRFVGKTEYDNLSKQHRELKDKIAEKQDEIKDMNVNISVLKEEVNNLKNAINECDKKQAEENEVKTEQMHKNENMLSPKSENEPAMLMRQLTQQNTMNRLNSINTMKRLSSMNAVKRLGSMRNASLRFITDVSMPAANEDALMPLAEQKEDSEEIFEYAFGEAFSYWKGYDYFPFIAPKHKNMKEELLRNKIKNVSIEDWDNIAYKASQRRVNIQNILGAAGDTNTPYARYNQQFNEVFGIPFETLISEKHIMSILFYTDLTDLPRCMKAICRKSSPKETNESFMKRHSELTNWLRLMSETILLYGNTYNKGNINVYHGLNRKFYFKEFKAKFFTPTSTTTDLNVALTFAEENGIILELGPMESRGDMYFDTMSLSEFPDEREYLFFWAELPIKAIYTNAGQDKFDMAPLSLYQSIVSGNIVIDKELSGGKKFYQRSQKTLDKFLNKIEQNDDDNIELSEVEQYGYDLLERYIKNQEKIRINKEEIMKKVASKKLRKHFIEQNDDKSFSGYSDSFKSLLSMSNLDLDNIGNSQTFTWTISLDDLANFVDPVHYTPLKSRPFRMKSEDRAKFYAQMDIIHESEDKIHGRMSLVLWKLKGTMSKTVSFDLFCKQLDKFYVRFHDIKMVLGGDDHECRQGVDFDIELIHKAIGKGDELEWTINIGE